MSDVLTRLLTETWPARAARSALDALMLPGDAYAGRVSMYGANGRTNPEVIGRSADLTGLLGSGGISAAQPGAAGIFGGRLAKTADHSALAKAEKLAAEGADAKRIWDETGWFQGADGKWRFEIDDSQSRVGSGTADFLGSAEVGAVKPYDYAERFLEHPALHEAYPFPALPNVQVTKGGGYPYSPSGFMQERASGLTQIGLDAATPSQARDVGLHELQHAIQKHEGFSTGAASPEVFKQDYALKLAQEINKKYRGKDDAGSEAARLAELDALFALNDKTPGGLGYHRSAGEVEARNVQTRRDMNAEQRRRLPPWATEDVPRALQILMAPR